MRSLSRAVNVRRRGRSDNSGDTEAGTAAIVGLRFPSGVVPASTSFFRDSMGIDEGILPRLRV